MYNKDNITLIIKSDDDLKAFLETHDDYQPEAEFWSVDKSRSEEWMIYGSTYISTAWEFTCEGHELHVGDIS